MLVERAGCAIHSVRLCKTRERGVERTFNEELHGAPDLGWRVDGVSELTSVGERSVSVAR